MPILHKRPANKEVHSNYVFLRRTLPNTYLINGFPLGGWFFEVIRNKEIVAKVSIDLVQIRIMEKVNEVPNWASKIADRIEVRIRKKVHIFLP